jgi:hypothetical protein
MNQHTFTALRTTLGDAYPERKALVGDDSAMVTWQEQLHTFDSQDVTEGARLMIHAGVEHLKLPVLVRFVRQARNERYAHTAKVPDNTSPLTVEEWKDGKIDEVRDYALANGLGENYIATAAASIRSERPLEARMRGLIEHTDPRSTAEFLASFGGGALARGSEPQSLAAIIGVHDSDFVNPEPRTPIPAAELPEPLFPTAETLAAEFVAAWREAKTGSPIPPAPADPEILAIARVMWLEPAAVAS